MQEHRAQSVYNIKGFRKTTRNHLLLQQTRGAIDVLLSVRTETHHYELPLIFTYNEYILTL